MSASFVSGRAKIRIPPNACPIAGATGMLTQTQMMHSSGSKKLLGIQFYSKVVLFISWDSCGHFGASLDEIYSGNQSLERFGKTSFFFNILQHPLREPQIPAHTSRIRCTAQGGGTSVVVIQLSSWKTPSAGPWGQAIGGQSISGLTSVFYCFVKNKHNFYEKGWMRIYF